MDTKNYKEKYENAIEIAKQNPNALVKDVVDKIFPELKESEDEKIRKVLLCHFSRYQKEEVFLNNITMGDVVSWLEKQGEQETIIIPKFRIGDKVHLINGTSPIYEDDCLIIGEISNNTYYGTAKEGWFKIEDQDKYELVEQKPVKWSEEDEKFLDYAIKAVHNMYVGKDKSSTTDIYIKTANWLKSLRPQNQRQEEEWSDEDKEFLKLTLSNLAELKDRYGEGYGRVGECIKWLNSLQPQPIYVEAAIAYQNGYQKALVEFSQKQQEWTDEDINMIDWLIRCCEKEHEELCNDRYGHQDIISDLKRDCRKKWDWLESLKCKVVPQK